MKDITYPFGKLVTSCEGEIVTLQFLKLISKFVQVINTVVNDTVSSGHESLWQSEYQRGEHVVSTRSYYSTFVLLGFGS